jgi:hypothetical protein
LAIKTYRTVGNSRPFVKRLFENIQQQRRVSIFERVFSSEGTIENIANHNNFGTLVGRVALRPDAPRSARRTTSTVPMSI